MSINTIFHSRLTISKLVVLAFLLQFISGCNARSTDQQGGAQGQSSAPYRLTLQGYNYTNRYIDGYSVNRQSGMNIAVSGPNNGGGGSVCCIMLYRSTKPLKVKIRWQSAGCTYDTKSDISDEIFNELHLIYSDRIVEIEPEIPADPRYLEVHFFPDGKVKAAITSIPSPPRLELSTSRADRSGYPICSDNKKPAES